MTDFKQFEQIEFEKDYHILFKFFVIQSGIGRQIVTNIKKRYIDKTDGEIVDLIKSQLNNSDPVDFLMILVNRNSKNETYWNRYNNIWKSFYRIHVLLTQIN